MSYLLLILGLPFLLALGTLHPFARPLSKALNPAWIVSGAMAVMFALVLIFAYQPVIVEQGAAVVTLSWVPQYNLNLSFYMDSLSLLFSLIITGVGAVVFLYAGFYFDDIEERLRFFRLLLIFAGAMLWLVLSGNLITLFIAWELTSITSFLLIGFKGAKYASARTGAMRALVVTGGGGLALLVGLLLLGTAGGTFELAELLTMDLSTHAWYAPMAILLMLGAFTKSAQFPFHFWLPGAMDAPTPASAFLHSATMVKAGVYLLARLHPVLSEAALWSTVLLTVGLITMFLSALLAVRQPDLKGLLAFTTTSKLGALVALLGVPDGYGVKAALVGIVAHALYKSALFLSVGSIDHATGTRLVSKLGGLWKYMPLTGTVVIISALSMAGLPPLLGFVAKETLLEAFMFNPLITVIVLVSAALTATSAYILIWDVFFARSKSELHFHALVRPLETGLLVLAGGTVVFALFITEIFTPLLTPLIPVTFKLVLFPGFNTVFWLSVAAIALGLGLFFLRGMWRRVPDFPLTAIRAYDAFIASLEWIADQALKTQNGKLRHYLIVVISVAMGILLYGGLVSGAYAVTDAIQLDFSLTDVLDIVLLVMAVTAAAVSVRVQRHLHAALALAIFGYAIGGVFLVEPSPDVALVQFLVETLATVVLAIMISRVEPGQRQDAMNVLKRKLNNFPDLFARIRDVTIATVTGICMSAFAFVALVNRDNRNTIAEWHLDNAYDAVGVTDVVSAILTDFRGTDTLIEISVFAVAALGLLALLTINRSTGGEANTVAETMTRNSLIATPLIQVVAAVVMPVALMVSAVHILYGANAPGDGFTAGVVAGLGIAMYYVVFGYQRVRARFRWLRPARMIIFGLMLALVNAVIPMLSGGAFMGLVDFAPWLNFANLKLTTTLVFETAIAVTVFGGVSLIMETIAHPVGVRMPNEDAAAEIPVSALPNTTTNANPVISAD